jgi:hypothetical protein
MRSDDRSVYMMEAPVEPAVSVSLLLHPLQNPLPDVRPWSAVEPAGDSFPEAIALGEITLGRSSSEEPEDADDDGPVIFVGSPGMGLLW